MLKLGITFSSLAQAAAVFSNCLWETRCSKYFCVTCATKVVLRVS